MAEPTELCSKDLAPLPEEAHVMWVSYLDPDGYLYYLECDGGYQYSSNNEGLLFCNMTTGEWDDKHAGNCTEAPFESTTVSAQTTMLNKDTTTDPHETTQTTSWNPFNYTTTSSFTSSTTSSFTSTTTSSFTPTTTSPLLTSSTSTSMPSSTTITSADTTTSFHTTEAGSFAESSAGGTDTVVPLAIGIGLCGLALFIMVVIISLFTLKRRKRTDQQPYTTYPAPSLSSDDSMIKNWNPSSLQDLNVKRLPEKVMTTKRSSAFFNSIHGYIPKMLADKKYGFKDSRDNKFITYVDVGGEGRVSQEVIFGGKDTMATLDRGRPRVRPALSVLNPSNNNLYTMDPTLPQIPTVTDFEDPAYESLYAESINPNGPRDRDDYIEHSNFAVLTTDRSRLVPKNDLKLTFM